MNTRIVTGYLPLKRAESYRSADRYVELGQQLLNVDRPITAFVDIRVPVYPGPAATLQPYTFEGCWLAQHLSKVSVPPTNNPEKDTAEFHAVQLQKSHWVAAASILHPASTLIWLDFGILHVPGATIELVRAFYDRVAASKIEKITMASIWPTTDESINPMQPNWYFAGGAFIVPHKLALWFASEVERATINLIEDTGYVTWEVNVWAKVAQRYPDLFDTWPCDHNSTMFTGFAGR